MSNSNFAYPFDPTGTASSNRVTGESQAISPPTWTDFYFVVPKAAPYYRDSMKIVHYPSGRLLMDGVDYMPSHRFHDASLATGKMIYGSITLFDKTLTGVLQLEYQTVGGAWTINEEKILEILSNASQNPRVTTWEQIVDLPERFPVIDHEWDLDDMVGAAEVVEKLNEIEQAIRDAAEAETGSGAIGAHLINFDNPHQVTALQVGLGNVQNYGIATQAQATAGTANNVYMTPIRVLQAINATAITPMTDHINDRTNPHDVSKEQVGLGLVPNLALANQAEAIAGTINTAFMTPLRVAEAITATAIASLNQHAGLTNPHNTTASDVGLGNVQNYPIATTVEAQAGTANNVYMTPLRVAEAIAASASSNITNHINNLNNPHSVTKAQVGLGLVQNYGVATQVDAEDGTSNTLYMTPLRVAQAINSGVQSDLNDHMDDQTNPHNVTKAQVGLSNVDNYPTATVADMLAGVSNERFATPAGVKAVVDEMAAGGGDSTHAGRTDNPHNVTKAQVGLGNVQNYGIATTADLISGSTTSYVTPAALLEYSAPIISILNDHFSDTANPHQVTKAQVGLGNVDNYSTITVNDLLELQVPGEVPVYPINQVLSPAAGSAMIDFALVDINTAIQLSSDHIANTNNPHNVTAAQLGVYTQAQANALLNDKLDANATAADSNLLEGMTLAQVRSSADDSVRLGGMTLSEVLANASGRILIPIAIIDDHTTYTLVGRQELFVNVAGDGLVPEPSIGFTISGGEVAGQIGPIDSLKVSLNPTNPAQSTATAISGENVGPGKRITLVQRQYSEAIDFGGLPPNDPDPGHLSNFRHYYEFWIQQSETRHTMEILQEREGSTGSAFWVEIDNPEDSIDSEGTSNINVVRVASGSDGGSAYAGALVGAVEIDVYQTQGEIATEQANREVSSYNVMDQFIEAFRTTESGGTVLARDVDDLFWGDVTGTDDIRRMTAPTFSPEFSASKMAALLSPPELAKTKGVVSFDFSVNWDSASIVDNADSSYVGIIFGHEERNGTFNTLSAAVECTGTGDWKIGYNLFTDSEVVLDSGTFTTAAVDPTISLSAIRTVDNQISIAVVLDGDDANPINLATNLEVNDYYDLFVGGGWGAYAYNAAEMDIVATMFPHQYRAATWFGGRELTIYDGMSSETVMMKNAALTKNANFIYSPHDGKLYSVTKRGTLRHLLIAADTIEPTTVLVP